MIAKLEDDPRDIDMLKEDLEAKLKIIKTLLDGCTAMDDALEELKKIKDHFGLFGE